MPVALTHEMDELIASMRAMNRQYPFIVSRAMNETIFEVRDHIVKVVWPKSVTLRNARFASAAMRVTQKSTKGNLVVELRNVLASQAFARQADGEVRQPRGKSIAVPQIKRGASGAVTKANRPRAMLEKPGYFVNRKGNAILRRMANGTIRVQYLLIPNARVTKRFPAYDEAEKTWNSKFNVAFERATEYAVSTAFKR